MKYLSLLTLLVFAAPFGWGEEVFVGTPLTKIEITNDSVQRAMLAASEQLELQAIIVKKDERYFWKTREMKELERHESGIYVTYQAVDGSGYVRIDSLTAIDSNTSQDISYIEHLKLGLNTITYQGWVVK